MPRNTLDDLRDHCFEALERLKDCDSAELESEIKRSKAVGDLTGRLVDTAKVEIDFRRAADAALSRPRASRLLTTAGTDDESGERAD